MRATEGGQEQHKLARGPGKKPSQPEDGGGGAKQKPRRPEGVGNRSKIREDQGRGRQIRSTGGRRGACPVDGRGGPRQNSGAMRPEDWGTRASSTGERGDGDSDAEAGATGGRGKGRKRRRRGFGAAWLVLELAKESGRAAMAGTNRAAAMS